MLKRTDVTYDKMVS